MAEMMPIMATTIMTSINVKPRTLAEKGRKDLDNIIKPYFTAVAANSDGALVPARALHSEEVCLQKHRWKW